MDLYYKQLIPIMLFVLTGFSTTHYFYFNNSNYEVVQGDLLNAMVVNLVDVEFNETPDSNEVFDSQEIVQENEEFFVNETQDISQVLDDIEHEQSVSSQDNQQAGLLGHTDLEPSEIEKIIIHLNHYKTYPARAQRRGLQGEVIVRITIGHSGQLVDYIILQSSGHEALDDTVKKMLYRASPFPVNNDENIVLEVPVEFTL